MAACVLDPKEIGTPLSDDQVSNVTNIFFFVTGGEVQNELSVFVIGKVFQPYLIFVDKTRSLPKRVTPKRPFSRRLWPYLHTRWIVFALTKTRAYFASLSCGRCST
jgi:hypothetical protein